MKKLLALSLAAVLALSLMGCSNDEETDNGAAAEETVAEDVLVYNDFEYAVNDDGDFEIIGYTYSGASSVDVEIPASIEGRPVTGIGADAFKALTAIKSVTIPASVEYVGDFAFYGCTGLTSVTLPDSVTSVGTGSFWGCSEVTSVTLSKALGEIGDYAFWNCAKLASVTLPDSLETIGEGAFWNCAAIKEISVPAAVKTVGRGAFIYCDALEKASFLSATVEIGEGAFDYCPDALVLVCSTAESTAKTFAEKESLNFKTFAELDAEVKQ